MPDLVELFILELNMKKIKIQVKTLIITEFAHSLRKESLKYTEVYDMTCRMQKCRGYKSDTEMQVSGSRIPRNFLQKFFLCFLVEVYYSQLYLTSLKFVFLLKSFTKTTTNS